MTEKEINERLKSGIYEIAPNCLDDIMEKISEKEEIKNTAEIKRIWSNKRMVSYLVSMAACFVILAGAYGGYQYNNSKITTIIELDVNPSIEFQVNKSEKVKKVVALNEDGTEIIENLSLEKETMEAATIDVMDELRKRGFITEESSTVLISVENDSQETTEKIKEKLSDKIAEHFAEDDIQITVLKQTIVRDEKVEAMAEEYHISTGKALLVKTMVEKNKNLKEEQLAEMTVDEIVKQADKENINLETGLSKKTKQKGEEKGTITEKAQENKKSEKTVTKSPIKNEQESKSLKEQDSEKTRDSDQKHDKGEKSEATQKQDKGEKAKPTQKQDRGEKPKPTEKQDGGEKPKPTEKQDEGEKPKPTEKQDGGEKPKPTKKQDGGEKPKPTQKQDEAEKPKPTQKQDEAEKMKPTTEPERTEKPHSTEKPEREERPQPTGKPEREEKPQPTGKPEREERPQPNGSEDSDKKVKSPQSI